MRYIYLIRHGKPYIPGEEHRCIGKHSDLSLSEDGRIQAEELSLCFTDCQKIYSSPMKRTMETARLIGGPNAKIIEVPDLDEIDVGEWEYKTFSSIRSDYAEVYRERGRDWSIPPTGGETLQETAKRAQASLFRLLHEDDGDLVVVSHDGIIRALLWKLMNLNTEKDAMPHQPYGSVTILGYENGAMFVKSFGKLPNDTPTDQEIERLWDICSTPEHIRQHCNVVCDVCMELRENLMKTDLAISQELLRAAAMLHDTCRMEGLDHVRYIVNLLKERGFFRVAQIIEAHHDIYFDGEIDEANILYLADKLVDGDRRVSLKERFDKSMSKCLTEEAVYNHDYRYDQAVLIQQTIVNRMKRWKIKFPNDTDF